METDKIFPPDPRYKIYVYPIIPIKIIKKFMILLPDAMRKWLDDKKDTRFYGLLATFIGAFKIEDLCMFIDKPDNEEFVRLLETNPLYAPSKGGMEFFAFTPISMLRRRLLFNLYEGPPIDLRSDYIEDVFDETIKTICRGKFDQFKDVNDRLKDFSENFENQTLEKFIYLTREFLCFPLEDVV